MQEFVGILEEIPQLIALCAQSLGSKLGSDLYTGNRRVFRHIADLVYLDGGFSRERSLKLLRERSWLGIAGRKSAYKPGKLRLRQSRCKVDTGDAGSRQELRKTALCGGRAQWHSVQKDLSSGSTKQ